MSNSYHVSVLLLETIENLNIQKGNKYIDATLGGGGHTEKILELGGKVLGIDQDQEALDFASHKLEHYIQEGTLRVAKGNFKDIGKIAKENGFENVSGILFDLGVSSHQLDSAERGFSIKHNSVLDMRMDTDASTSALDVVNSYSEQELTDIFMQYGEEEKANLVAAKIVEARRESEIKTTGDLSQIIELVIGRNGKYHPATKIFQALRIEVNHELESLKKGLREALELVSKNGRIVVIAFHSLEDRIVKLTFQKWELTGKGTDLYNKPIIAGGEEIYSNPRARSAKLRVFKKS